MSVELKDVIEAQGRAWEEFKKANDARLAAIESKGYAPADMVGKVDVINADISKLSKELAEIKLAQQRPAMGDGKAGTPEHNEHKQAFGDYLRKGRTDGLGDLQRKAMNSTDDPDGGYLIPMQMEQEIARVVGTVGALPRLVRNMTIGTRAFQTRVQVTGMTMGRPAEGAGLGETTEPTFSRIEIVAHPAEVEPWVANETLEDADIDLTSLLTGEAAISFAEGLADELVDGTGVGRCRGITSYTCIANASYAWGSVGYIASGKSAAFASVAPSDYIIDLQHALKPQYRQGAVWVMADSTLAEVRSMKDASGAYYLWQPDPLSGFAGRLLGSPVETDDNMAVIAANSYSIAYGNWQRAYTVVNRTGISVIRDNVTTKGVTKFNFRRRFGGGITNFEALKLMKFATS